MKPFVLTLAAICLIFAGCARDIVHTFAGEGGGEFLRLTPTTSRTEGSWKIDLAKLRAHRRHGVHIQIQQDRSIRGFWLPSERVEGLFGQQTEGSAINFAIGSDAGALAFDGVLNGKIASGSYSFKRHQTFTAETAKVFKRELTDDEAFEYVVSDLTLEYIREAHQSGLASTPDTILSLKRHGLTAQAIKEYVAAGFSKASDLTRLRSHGVAPQYISEWKNAGFNFTAEEFTRLRSHGVQTDFAKAAPSAKVEELVRLRQHGVPPEYYREIRALNYTAEEIVRFRQHGTTAEYVKSLSRFSAEDIVKLRQHGVPADYVLALNVPGRSDLDAKTIIDLRNRGISVETARKLRQ